MKRLLFLFVVIAVGASHVLGPTPAEFFRAIAREFGLGVEADQLRNSQAQVPPKSDPTPRNPNPSKSPLSSPTAIPARDSSDDVAWRYTVSPLRPQTGFNPAEFLREIQLPLSTTGRPLLPQLPIVSYPEGPRPLGAMLASGGGAATSSVGDLPPPGPPPQAVPELPSTMALLAGGLVVSGCLRRWRGRRVRRS